MIEIRKTEIFTKWFETLKDLRAKARILARIDRMGFGNFGDVSPVGEGISEMRIFYGPGYPFILSNVDLRLSSCFLEVIKALNQKILLKPKKLLDNWRINYGYKNDALGFS